MSTHILRRLTRPMSRPAALFLLWSHRRTVALWLRSCRAELAHGQVESHDVHRWKALISALWRASKDSSLLQENELRRLVVADDEALVVSLRTDPLDASAFTQSGVETVIGLP